MTTMIGVSTGYRLLSALINYEILCHFFHFKLMNDRAWMMLHVLLLRVTCTH